MFGVASIAPFGFFFFVFNDTATTEIYTLSLHDALPILPRRCARSCRPGRRRSFPGSPPPDRKSTRLNSSHDQISYAVFCLEKKKQTSKKYRVDNKKNISNNRKNMNNSN